MKVKMLASIFSLVLVLVVPPVAAQETADETDILNVVNGFYGWARAYSEPDADGNFRNVVVDRAYRDSEYLTANFIGTIDRMADEGLHYDPFTCAQDFYSRIDAQVVAVDGEQATVLLMEYFGDNPFSHNNTVQLVKEGGVWKIDAVICGENITPEGVVENFYNWYLRYSQPDESGSMRNPLLEGAYRDYEYLAPEFVSTVDAVVEDMQPDAVDPFCGTQDRPAGVSVDRVSIDDSMATVMVHEYLPGGERHDLLVELRRAEDTWLINNVVAEATPEAAALVFYNQYMAYMRYDLENGIDQVPILHWGGRWQDYLTVELILSLIHIYTDDEPLIADPVLCAQDIPARVSAETVELGDTFARIAIYGEYPSGPDTFTRYSLATVYSNLVNGRWLLSYIGCGEPASSEGR